MPKVKSAPSFKGAATFANPSRAWCVTWNNPSEETIQLARDGKLLEVDKGHLRYCVFQLEKGECGTPHFQMYIEFSKPVRMAAVKALLSDKVHCEPRCGTREAAREYCQKDDTRTEGFWEVGSWTGGQGARSDLLQLLDLAKEGAPALSAWEAAPEAMARYSRAFGECRLAYAMGKSREGVRVIVFYGDSGTGKTHDVEELLKGHVAAGQGVYRKAPGKWWDGYNLEPVVVMDEFYGSSLSYAEFLRIIDKYPMVVETKGGTVPLHATTFYITSNASPADWYPNVANKLPVVRRLFSCTRYTSTPHGTARADILPSLLKAARDSEVHPPPPFSAGSHPE